MRNKVKTIIAIIGACVLLFGIFPFLITRIKGGSTPQKVEKKLGKKYGEKFVVTSIGNRLNTGSATLWCHPASDPDLNFKAVYTFSDKSLTDEYLNRKMSAKLENELDKALNEAGFEASSYMVLWNANTDGLENCSDVKEFVKKSGAGDFYIRIAIKESEIKDVEDVREWLYALLSFSRKYDDIKIIAVVFPIRDELYETCSKALKKAASVNDEWFEQYGANDSFTTNIMDKKPQMSAEEIFEEIKSLRNKESVK